MSLSQRFAGLKEKLADKFAELKASAAPLTDPLDRQVSELVDKATSDELIAPDWAVSFAVVDFVNSDVRLNSGRALRAIKRSLSKQSGKVQLLSLTLLETCVKNCASEFHVHLATSELWADIVKLAGDSSISRVDGEVRDKALVLVEDFARALQPSQFQAAYENLLDTGVDFPVRSPEDAVPILTPPAHHTAAASAGEDAVAAAAPLAQAAGAEVAAAGGAGGGGGGEDSDPLADVDEQDRAAIAAALQELEAEAQAASEAERVAAEADAEERRQRREQERRRAAEAAEAEAQAAAALLAADQLAQAAALAGGGQADTGAAAGAAPGTLGAASEGQGPGAQQQAAQEAAAEQTPEERVTGLMETASNSTMLFNEMLASIPDSEPLAVREPYVAELGDTCVRLRSRLERELSRLEDEALLASALSQHEELSRVLGRYEELLAAAESVAPSRPRRVAAPHAAPAGSGAAAAPPQYPPVSQAAQEVPMGEKVSQTAAAVAAAFKEKVSGAFDKIKAAAAAARAPAATSAPGQASGSGIGAAADAFGGAYGGVSVGGTLPPVQEGGEGTFTLLDDDEEEDANEGTSLITKRAPPPPPSYQPPSYYSPAETWQPEPQQWQPPPPLQQQPAVAPVAAAPVAAAPPAADLICFEEEATEVPQQPGTASTEARAAGETTQEGAGPDPFQASGDLLPDLDLHSPGSSGPAPVAQAAPALAPSELEPRLPAPAPVAVSMTHGSVARLESHGDQLVEALDALVAQASTGNTPMAAAAEQRQEAP